MKGYIHSIETMGLVDGPGVRGVLFLQGCPLRCCYCHNPDAWKLDGTQTEASFLVDRLARFKAYYGRSGGGVTISGGEPLCQPAFLLDLLTHLKAENIHTCLDTAGSVQGDFRSVLKQTDLILFDVKHPDPVEYHKLTGGDIAASHRFLAQAEEVGVPMIIRHVVIPGITDSHEHLLQLQAYIEKIPNVQGVELLPYHKMGSYKYTAMGLSDPLQSVAAMDPHRCRELQNIYF